MSTNLTSPLVKEVDEALKRIEQTNDVQLKAELQTLLRRLDDPRKWVAVFGAFSAGKSSLINALLRDHPLAVSPHPTTAAITQVEALHEGNEASVTVTAKTPEQMWEDVERALSHLHLTSSDLAGAIQVAERLRPADFPSGARRHVNFLKAVASGYDKMNHRLGQTWSCTGTELESMTSDESIACYVQKVDLYHNAEILKNGMVLVDTPGVDSIHRRHTDVAFEFMRRADAVLFVLYYSHAFARADEAFLSQLAQVQDIAGVNKLFVVINAVDLAVDETERAAVTQRVRAELRRVGVLHPRVYEVSSQVAFAASRRAAGDTDAALEGLIRQRLRIPSEQSLPNTEDILHASGVPALQLDLDAFLSNQAYQIAESAVQATFKSIELTLETRVNRFKREQMEDEAALQERRARQANLALELKRTARDLENAGSEDEQAMRGDFQELVFHAGERVRLGFSANFRSAFHSGLFRAKGNPRALLQEAATELMEVVSRQVEAETRTFGLRAEARIHATLERLYTRVSEQMRAVEADAVLEAPSFDSAAVNLLPERANLSSDVLQPFFRHFSTAAQFFEGGGQKEMLQRAEPEVCRAAREVQDRLAGRVLEEWMTVFRSQATDMIGQATACLEGSEKVSAVDATTVVQYEQVLAWFREHVQKSMNG